MTPSRITLVLFLTVVCALPCAGSAAHSPQEQYMTYFESVAKKIGEQCKDLPAEPLTIEVRIRADGKLDKTIPLTQASAGYRQSVISAIDKAGPFGPPPFADLLGATIGIPLDINGPSVSVDRSALTVPSRTTPILWSRSEKLLNEGQFDEALKLQLMVEQLNPNRFVREGIGKTYYKQAVALREKHSPTMIAALERSIAYNPTYKQSSIDLDSALLEQGKDPTSGPTRYAMAQEHLHSGNKLCAIAELMEACSLNQNDKWQSELTELKKSVFETQASMSSLADKMPTSTPTSPYANATKHLNSGLDLLFQRKYTDAAVEYDSASSAVPFLGPSTLVRSHTKTELGLIQVAMTGKAIALRLAGKADEAAILFNRISETNAEQKREDSLDCAEALSELAILQHSQGQDNKAVTALTASLEALTRFSSFSALEITDVSATLGGILRQTEQDKSGLAKLQSSQWTRRIVLGEQHPDFANGWPQPAPGHGFKEDFLPRAKNDLEAIEASLNGSQPDLTMALAMEQYAGLLIVDHQFQSATDLLTRSMAIKQKLGGNLTPRQLDELCELASCSIATSSPKQAVTYYESALDVLSHSTSLPPLPMTCRLLIIDGIANAAERANDTVKAEENYKTALQIRRDWYWHDHPDVATSLVSLANFYIRNDRIAEAEPLLSEANSIREKVFGHASWPGFPAMDVYAVNVKQRFQQTPVSSDGSGTSR